MKGLIMRPAIRFLGICLIVLSLCSGCAHLSNRSKGPDALKMRVQELWTAKKQGDWAKVYDMTCKAYRDKVSKQKFLTGPKLRARDFAIEDISIIEPGKRAVVTVKAKLDVMGRTLSMVLKENWIWEDGQWRLNLVPTPLGSLLIPKPGKELKGKTH